MPLVLQIGANSHSEDFAFAHDPVPRLIAKGWSAILIEPQPTAASALRAKYASNVQISVVQAAFCPDATARLVPLYFINGTKSLGANESDIRCVGEAILGTASFSRSHVLQFQRWYRYTPSQCAKCAKRLGRPLPPTCMRQLYTANLDVADVPCARPEQIVATSGGGSGGSSSSGGSGGNSGSGRGGREDELHSHRRPADAVIVDVEGEDDHVVLRYLELTAALGRPSVLVYEHAHLRSNRRSALESLLQLAGMTPYRHAEMKQPPPGRLQEPSERRHWATMRHILARVNTHDNAVWVRAAALGGAAAARAAAVR